MNITNEAIDTVEIILEAGDLNDALRRVRHAICHEKSRYYLNGVSLSYYASQEGMLRFVATNGHLLSLVDIPAPDGAIKLCPAILASYFVTRAIKATNRTRDAFEHVRLAVSPTRVTLTDWAGNAIDGTLIDGTFPHYENVIPRGEPQHGSATLAREAFMRAVTAVTAFVKASETRWHLGPVVRFTFAGDKLTISGVIEDCGSASVTVDLAETTMREPPEIGFHGPQILDILNALRGKLVRFNFFDVSGPNSFVGDRADSLALHVIMPKRI